MPDGSSLVFYNISDIKGFTSDVKPESGLYQDRNIGRLGNHRTVAPVAHSSGYIGAIVDCTALARDLPSGVRTIAGNSAGLGGASFTAMTSLLFAPVSAVEVYESVKEIKHGREIRDKTAVTTAKMKLVERASLAAGSALLLGDRVMGIANEVAGVAHQPIQWSSGALALQACLNFLSSAMFLIYYTVYGSSLVLKLTRLWKGRELREELQAQPYAIERLKNRVKGQIAQEVRTMTEEQLKEMAVDEGSLLLKRTARGMKKEPSWNKSDQARREKAEELLRRAPVLMQQEMGLPPSFLEGVRTDELVRFGMMIAHKRCAAKYENEYNRLLGPEAVEAAKEGNEAKFKELLGSLSWKKDAIKLGLTVIGFVSVILAMALSGGTALGVVLILSGIAGLIWIFLSDGEAFKKQWAEGLVKKRDKWIIVMSVVLSVVSLAGLIALSVASGGVVPFAISIALTSAWFIVNCRAVAALYQREHRPWDYQKVPTPKVFNRFVQTNPSEDHIEKVLKKMTEGDQEGLRARHKLHKGDWKAAAKAWAAEVKLRETQHRDFLLSVLA